MTTTLKSKAVLLLLAVLMALAAAYSPAMTPAAFAGAACANNDHYHVDQPPWTGQHWDVWKVTQVGPNQIKKHWRWRQENSHTGYKGPWHYGSTIVC